MRRDDASFLLDMLVAARDAADFADGLPYDEYARDRRHQLAIVKALEIVGEAASRLSDETRNLYPEIPWREIVGMRHRLVHAYFDIDLRLVWDTVHGDLPSQLRNWRHWYRPRVNSGPHDARPANRRIVHSREFVPCHGAGEVTEPNSTAPSSCAPCSSSRPVAISQTVASTANGSGSFAAAPSRGGLDRSEAALQHAAPKERKE